MEFRALLAELARYFDQKARFANACPMHPDQARGRQIDLASREPLGQAVTVFLAGPGPVAQPYPQKGFSGPCGSPVEGLAHTHVTKDNLLSGNR